MRDGDNLKKTSAVHHIQQAIEEIEDTLMKTRETLDVLDHLKSARSELVYEIFRSG